MLLIFSTLNHKIQDLLQRVQQVQSYGTWTYNVVHRVSNSPRRKINVTNVKSATIHGVGVWTLVTRLMAGSWWKWKGYKRQAKRALPLVSSRAILCMKSLTSSFALLPPTRNLGGGNLKEGVTMTLGDQSRGSVTRRRFSLASIKFASITTNSSSRSINITQLKLNRFVSPFPRELVLGL